jgi:hypothetical protein
MSKEPIKKANGSLAISNFEADANKGMGNLTQDDLALPFLKILGQLSPEVNKRDGKYVEGAQPGMIFNSVTGDLFDGERGVNNYIEKTAQHFVIVCGEVPTTALIAMKSTQLKISRKWNSMMQSIKLKGKNGMFTPASFSHEYLLKTNQQSNDKGSWFGWEISKVGPIENADLYQQAKSFAESIGKGDVQVKHGEEQTGEASHY